MSDKSKSILDGVEIKGMEKAFPALVKVVGKLLPAESYAEPLKEIHSIVGACTACGAPIYGQSVIKAGVQPVAVFSCECSPARWSTIRSETK